MERIAALVEVPPFVKRAIADGKWAFAADWARFLALEREGGFYLDYDVELVSSLDPLRERGPFVAGQWMPNGSVGLEPAVLALEKGSPIAEMMLAHYATAVFDGKTTAGERLMSIKPEGLMVLPPEVMCPIDIEGRLHRTERTVGIHWYAMSWASPQRKLARWLSWHGCRGLVDALVSIRRNLIKGER